MGDDLLLLLFHFLDVVELSWHRRGFVIIVSSGYSTLCRTIQCKMRTTELSLKDTAMDGAYNAMGTAV